LEEKNKMEIKSLKENYQVFLSDVRPYSPQQDSARIKSDEEYMASLGQDRELSVRKHSCDLMLEMLDARLDALKTVIQILGGTD
jgi:hypothetical protein